MRVINLTGGYGSRWGSREGRVDPDHQWGSWAGWSTIHLDEPVEIEAKWDELEDFEVIAPMRPKLRYHHGVWDDLADTNGSDLERLAGWVDPELRELDRDLDAEFIAERSARAREIVRNVTQQRDEAARLRQLEQGRRRPAPYVPLPEVSADRRNEVARTKARRKTRRAVEKAARVVSQPVEAPAPASRVGVCTCGHEAAEHGRSGVCMGVETGTPYVCNCTDYHTERNAS